MRYTVCDLEFVKDACVSKRCVGLHTDLQKPPGKHPKSHQEIGATSGRISDRGRPNADLFQVVQGVPVNGCARWDGSLVANCRKDNADEQVV